MNKVQEIEEKIAPVIESEKMELVDVTFGAERGKKVLRVFIDKEGGVQLSDCEAISDKLGTFIDQSNAVTGPYVLEVSSPGLDRVLKKEKDFIRFIGKKVRITAFAPIEGQRNFAGKIVSAGGGAVTVDDVTGKAVTIRLENIARARLEPEI